MRMAQLMPLPLTVSCFSKIQIGFTFTARRYASAVYAMALCPSVSVCLCLSVTSRCSSRFSRTPTCDRQADRQTDTDTVPQHIPR